MSFELNELVAAKRSACCTGDPYNKHMCTILASNGPKGPEQKDIMSNKQKVLTVAPYFSCDIDKEELNGLKWGATDRLSHTDRLLKCIR